LVAMCAHGVQKARRGVPSSPGGVVVPLAILIMASSPMLMASMPFAFV